MHIAVPCLKNAVLRPVFLRVYSSTCSSVVSVGLSKRGARLRSLWRALKVTVQSTKRTTALIYYRKLG